MIGILDYGVGNVGAFLRIFHSQNIAAMPITDPADFEIVDKIILPGVGAFDSAMIKLNNSGLREALDHFVTNVKIPILGVCIGMHMLGSYSEEGSSQGLGYIRGYTKKFPVTTLNTPILLPHMGWNDIIIRKQELIWTDVNLEEGFYFLHSYYFVPEIEEETIAMSEYHIRFSCAVNSLNIFGFQFHPEKSLSNGIQLLRNFSEKI